jgi:hypothetical protein
MSDAVELVIITLITKNPLAVSLLGSVVLSIVGFFWTVMPFRDCDSVSSVDRFALTGFLAFIVGLSGAAAFLGCESWPGIIMLGGITRSVLGKGTGFLEKIPLLQPINSHVQAYKDLITGYYDERVIYHKHASGELGYWKGAYTYLVYAEREQWWWVRGLDIASRPCTALAIANALLLGPTLGCLVSGRSLGDEIAISLGTAFIANFWIVGGGLFVFRQIVAQSVDKNLRPSEDEMELARERLEKYDSEHSLLLALFTVLVLIVVGSYGMAILFSRR